MRQGWRGFAEVKEGLHNGGAEDTEKSRAKAKAAADLHGSTRMGTG